MITCYEYDVLRPGEPLLEALQTHFGEGKPYYSLVRDGVNFNQFVGVLQIGRHTIEVLPKVDRIDKGREGWRRVLIDMLRKVHGLELKTTEHADLKLKPNSILDLYMELYVQEVAYLMRQGLTKSYRKTEGNRTALKGKLLFAQNIRHNLVHAERFYVEHSTYDRENAFNCILRKALLLVGRMSAQASLRARVSQLLLDFPELPDIAVQERTFQRLPWSRKTECYRKSIEIARLLLLHYHPDIRGGHDEVIALMFDMNKLWERFILAELRRSAPAGWTVEGQSKALFWEAEEVGNAHLKPDILLRAETRQVVLDTKWKMLGGDRPSDADLRQLFAYQHQWGCQQGFLVYPGEKTVRKNGQFQVGQWSLDVMHVDVLAANGALNPKLGDEIWKSVLER